MKIPGNCTCDTGIYCHVHKRYGHSTEQKQEEREIERYTYFQKCGGGYRRKSSIGLSDD